MFQIVDLKMKIKLQFNEKSDIKAVASKVNDRG